MLAKTVRTFTFTPKHKLFANFSLTLSNHQILILSVAAFVAAAPEAKPGVITSQQTVTTTQHASPLIAAASPIVAASPLTYASAPIVSHAGLVGAPLISSQLAYSSPLVSPYVSQYVSPYAASPLIASPYLASAGIYNGYYGAGLAAPIVAAPHAAPIVSAGLTVPSVYGYSLNSGLVSPYANYLLLKKKK